MAGFSWPGYRRAFQGLLVSLAVLGPMGAAAADPVPESLETAALPQVPPFDPKGAPLVLSPTDVKLYKRIRAAQARGDWADADTLISQLSDTRLLGHLLYQRYMHPTAWRSRYAELAAWLDVYADHPGAAKIHRLALKRKPAGAPVPRPAAAASGERLRLGVTSKDPTYKSPRARSAAERRAVRDLKNRIRRNVFKTRLSVTEKLLNDAKTQRLLDSVEIDQGRALVAGAWFYYGDTKRAYGLAGAAADRSGGFVPHAQWIAGLSAWRLGQWEAAYDHFATLAQSDYARSWDQAGGAYWAARAALRLQRPAEMSGWLNIAARHPRTFYGILGREALGIPLNFAESGRDVTDAKIAAFLRKPKVARAVALLQLGEQDLAEAELLGLDLTDDPAGEAALLLLAERAGLPSLSFRMGARLAARDGAAASSRADIDAALYPIPPWVPASGFKVDRALVYALMRQESTFRPTAVSRDGARGLMQLMPATASFVAGDRSLRQRGGRDRLLDPSFNLDLAQRYIVHLMEDAGAGDDLFRFAAAYNGGPGNLRKWEQHLAKAGHDPEDPLLFIESLPSRETRLFIERVLTNLWLYRTRLGQPAPSLETLAAGDRPLYRALD